jgi:hypothetical protein
MAKFAIGDVVKKDKGRTGTVRAIFTTIAGELCYAVEHVRSISLRKPSCRIAQRRTWPLRLKRFRRGVGFRLLNRPIHQYH